jgi:ketosteroid isomerase-like protein
MKLIRIVLSTFFCIIFLSYSNIFAQEDEVRKFIESIEDDFSKAALKGDYETILSYFADDVIVVPIFQPPIKGKKAYREELNKLKKQGVKYQSISGIIADIWECGNMVYETGTFAMSLIRKESARPEAYYGSYFQIWQKQSDESYKLKYMISNLDFNPFGK